MKYIKFIIDVLHFSMLTSFNNKKRNGLKLGWKLAKITNELTINMDKAMKFIKWL